MITRIRHFFLLAGFAGLVIACDRSSEAPPETRVDSIVDTLHGIPVADPYRWLEDQQSPETRAWIDAQNAYSARVLAQFPGREEISRRVTELLRVESITMPMARGDRRFLMRRSPDQQLFVIYMSEGQNGVDQKLIDPHTLSADQRTTVELLDVTGDGNTLTYAVRQGGEDEVEIRFFDVESRTDLPERLPRARYFGASLLQDRSGIYYTRQDSAGPRVYYHAMNTPAHSDRMLFGEGYGPERIITSAVTEDERWLGLVVFHGAAADQTEVHYMDLRTSGPIRTLVKDLPARFFPYFAGDYLLLQTNWNAPNGRLLRVSLAQPAQSNWKEIVPQSDAVLEAVSAAAGRIFITSLKDVQSKLSIYDLEGKQLSELDLPAVGSVAGVSGRWASPEVFYSFVSFHLPLSIYRYDALSGQSSPWFTPHVPVDPSLFEVKQVFLNSKDSTRIPMFLVHRKGLPQNGQNPVLLTGYGGFNVSLTPYFTSEAVITAERGGIFALVNLRGGGEYGEDWHRAGMLANKQNVFDDFIAAAEWLIEENYTTAGRLGIVGASNGGLLVGAAMTQRPELFGAVICEYPLLDMVRYDRFLVAKYWVPEYGSAGDSAQFQTLMGYSPYHNVKDGTAYPAVLFITGDSDTRVAPLHARKMAAHVQAASSSGRPVLLLYDTKSGHAGGVPVNKQIEDLASSLVFFFAQTGGGGSGP